MYGQYIADGTIDAPLLLVGDFSAANAAVLIDVFGRLASGQTDSVAVHHLLGWEPRDRLSLEAVAAGQDAGCAFATGSDFQLRCLLRPRTWDQIVGLLAPFARSRTPGHAHQYLSQHVSVTWIVSTEWTYSNPKHRIRAIRNSDAVH